MISWQTEGFAVAVDIDEKAGSYLGLTAGSHPGEIGPNVRLVKPEFALGQLEAEKDDESECPEGEERDRDSQADLAVTLFSGVVNVDPDRPNKEFSTITQEVLEHLTALVGTNVSIELRIQALREEGFPEDVIRIVTENARTLKFNEGSGFEEA